jgi:hypothetical protein
MCIFGIIAEAFEAAAEADHLLEARDMGLHCSVVAEDVRQRDEGGDDGDSQVPEGDGAIG